jgi:hypothetical protein
LEIITKLVAVGMATTQLKVATNKMRYVMYWARQRMSMNSTHTFGMKVRCLQEYGRESKEHITLHIQPPHLNNERPTLPLKEGMGVLPMKAISILQNIQ